MKNTFESVWNCACVGFLRKRVRKEDEASSEAFMKNFKRRWDKKPISIFINTYQLHNKSKQKTSLQLARGGVHSQQDATADHKVILQCLGCKITAGASVCRLK